MTPVSTGGVAAHSRTTRSQKHITGAAVGLEAVHAYGALGTESVCSR